MNPVYRRRRYLLEPIQVTFSIGSEIQSTPLHPNSATHRATSNRPGSIHRRSSRISDQRPDLAQRPQLRIDQVCVHTVAGLAGACGRAHLCEGVGRAEEGVDGGVGVFRRLEVDGGVVLGCGGEDEAVESAVLQNIRRVALEGGVK